MQLNSYCTNDAEMVIHVTPSVCIKPDEFPLDKHSQGSERTIDPDIP